MTTSSGLTFEPRLITEVVNMRSSRAYVDAVRLRTGGAGERYAFVSRSAVSNGVVQRVPRQGVDPEPGGGITLGVDTQTVFYQPAPFYTGNKVIVLRSPQMDVYSGVVLTALIGRAIAKFSWGYGASAARLRQTRAMVLVDENGDVDWDGLSALGRATFGTLSGLAIGAVLPFAEAARPTVSGES